MADYYRSKEVYKQHHNLDHESTIIPVRGLYVSGTHLEAVYEDHVITVTGFTSSPLEFYDYTTKTTNMQTESAYRILDVFCVDDGVTLVDYTQRSQNLQTESAYRILDVFCADDGVTMVDFESKTINMQTESAYRILDVFCVDDGVTMVDYVQTNQSFGRESVVTVLDFTSNDLTISEG